MSTYHGKLIPLAIISLAMRPVLGSRQSGSKNRFRQFDIRQNDDNTAVHCGFKHSENFGTMQLSTAAVLLCTPACPLSLLLP
jgi:hypothetical protein